MKRYAVKEIFGPTIQGEGTHAGKVVLFLRFAGCNRWSGQEKDRAASTCSFCDTDFVKGQMLTKEEIRDALYAKSTLVDTVVLSGGEPTLQIDEELLSLLCAEFDLHLETNGSKDIGLLDKHFTHITMSPKQSARETKLKKCDAVKLLFPYIKPEISMERFDEFPAHHFYLQPVMGPDYQNNLNLTILTLYKNPNWKLSLQTHKILGVQ